MVTPGGLYQAFCECPSYNCRRFVWLPTEKYMAVRAANLIVIADDCVSAPVPGDVLVEQCDGFKVYRPDPSAQGGPDTLNSVAGEVNRFFALRNEHLNFSATEPDASLGAVYALKLVPVTPPGEPTEHWPYLAPYALVVARRFRPGNLWGWVTAEPSTKNQIGRMLWEMHTPPDTWVYLLLTYAPLVIP